MKHKPQKIVICGAYGGIGHAITRCLAQTGNELILLGRNEEKLSALQKTLSVSSRYHVLDLQNTQSIYDLTTTIYNAEKSIDILINAAGITPPFGDLFTVEEADWHTAMMTSLMGNMALVKSFGHQMTQQKSGKIILINGVLSIQPNPFFIISSTLTGALRNFAKAAAKTLGQSGVTLNVVNPGLTQTDLAERVLTKVADATGQAVAQLYKSAADDIPLGRLAEPEDIAHYVDFLCQQNTTYLNGTTLNIDGGYTITA